MANWEIHRFFALPDAVIENDLLEITRNESHRPSNFYVRNSPRRDPGIQRPSADAEPSGCLRFI
jgi:hypothetical protein